MSRFSKKESKTYSLDSKVWFGKHRGRTIKTIIDLDVTYVEWCCDNDVFELDDEAFRFMSDTIESTDVDFLDYDDKHVGLNGW